MTKEELKNKCTERAKIFQQAMESCKSSSPMDCIEWFADRIAELEKENEQLKSIAQFQQSSNMKRHFEIQELEKKNKGLEEELKKWKDEWQEQVQKAIDEGYARTQQTIQLTKAKALLAKWVELYKPKSDTALPTPIQVETEQFLNSELQSKWINPARTTNDNKIKLN